MFEIHLWEGLLLSPAPPFPRLPAKELSLAFVGNVAHRVYGASRALHEPAKPLAALTFCMVATTQSESASAFKFVLSRARPTEPEYLDLHPFCVVCLGLKHAEEAVVNPEHCKTAWRFRRSIFGAASKSQRLSVLSRVFHSDEGHGDVDMLLGASRSAAPLSWADQANSAFPEEDIFVGNLPCAIEPAGSGDEDDAGLLGASEAFLPYCVPLASAPAALPQSVLFDRPAPQSATDQDRDIYEGKLLGPPPGPRKQLFPILPACVKHMRHNCGDPLDLKHGLTGLEVKDMGALGLGDPPAVEPSIARQLSQSQFGPEC